MTSVFTIARAQGRDYITPEDVGDALGKGCPAERVRVDVLRTIGEQTGWGIEDASLCAFLAAEDGEGSAVPVIRRRR